MALLIVLAFALAGCGGGQDESGGSGDSGSSAPETTSSAGAATTEDTVMEETSIESTSMEDTSSQGAAPEDGDGMSTALEGIEEAQSEAESWNEDAELYSIVSRPPDVNAQGENSGWQYAFVSESGEAIALIFYRGGESQGLQEQPVPGAQAETISSDALPVGNLVDSSEALERSGEVQNYLEENPDSGISASVDSASSDEPEWILQAQQGQLNERVPAVE